jgi:thioester reductase-like protein/aryl carrier-like protein
MYMLWAIPAACIPIAPAAVGIVTAHGLVEALKHTPADVAVLVPSVVADLAQNPEQLATCAKRLSLILYIGGDLPQAIGDIVARQIPLRCWWGASEVGIPHQLIPPGLGPNDWRYIRFHPSVGAIFDPVADGTYELVIRQDKSLSGTQSTFSIRGQEKLEEYRTKDLFQPHPTVPNAWCWRSRADDIIVFLNGEKTNPIGMEQHVIAQRSELRGALVVGTQRFQAALLIEPVDVKVPLTTLEQAVLIEKIWPSVKEANAVVPAHARVEKALVLVVDRPMIRSGKGTIQRAASIQQYSANIEALYINADVTGDGEDVPGEASWNSTDASTVSRLIRDSVCSVVGRPMPDESSFFDYGMDSLMALQILRRLRRGLHRPDLGLSTIYSNPSVAQLSTAITAQEGEPDKNDDALLMQPMFSTYRSLLEQIPKPKLLEKVYQDTPVTAVLTGSTGTVGTFLLQALLDRPGIEHVFCLNRSEDGGRAAQKLRMAERGINSDVFDGRATFLQSDLSRPHLGLDDKIYERLRDRVGLIVHNAWPVNFNLRLPAFRQQLAGLVNLFSFSADASSAGRMAHVVFISSVSAVGIQGPSGGSHPAPERVLSMSDAPQTNGYARSKFLAELLCDSAAHELRIPVTIARLGQVAGAVQQQGGEWNRNEWLPSLVLGSVSMRCIPEDLGPQFSEIDWLPVDLLVSVLVELISHQTDFDLGETGSARVYNLRNPQTTTWSQLLPSITDTMKTLLGPHHAPEVVPPAVWLKRLGDDASKETWDGAVIDPAIKLLEFYRDYLWRTDEHDGKMPPMSIELACADSSTLRGVQAISSQWMQKWVSEWMK